MSSVYFWNLKILIDRKLFKMDWMAKREGKEGHLDCLNSCLKGVLCKISNLRFKSGLSISCYRLQNFKRSFSFTTTYYYNIIHKPLKKFSRNKFKKYFRDAFMIHSTLIF